MKKLTLENFKEVTPKKPLVVEVGDNNNFFIKISVSELDIYCIDMFYDHKLKTECNRIYTLKEIHNFGADLLLIHKFISIIKGKKCSKD